MLLPLAVPIESRDGTLTKDAKRQNTTLMQTSEGMVVEKRPGLSGINTYTANYVEGTTGIAHAGIYYDLVIINETLQSFFPSIGFTAQALPGLTIPLQRFQSIDGIPTPAGSLSLTPAPAFFKNNWQAWTMTWDPAATAPVVTLVSDADYPTRTVPGSALIDGTYYVMDLFGTINGSDLQNPTSWNALNFITIDGGIGGPVAITRHLNYVLAFGNTGLQLFYDAANASPGSPLLPLPNSTLATGCADPYSIQHLGDTTVFMAQGEKDGRTIMGLTGLSLQILSTPAIDRILARSRLTANGGQFTVDSWAMKTNGNSYYSITLRDLDLTLVLDMVKKDWSVWSTRNTGGTASAWSMSLYRKLGIPDLTTGTAVTDGFVGFNNGQANVLSPLTLTDVTFAPIDVVVVTPPLKESTMDRKFLSAINIIGDTSANIVQVQYTNDDFQTLSTAQPIDMSTVRKQTRRLGSYRKRSFVLTCVGSLSTLRMTAIEIPDQDSTQG